MLTRVAVTTLGCKTNQYEAEALAGLFDHLGLEVVPASKEADIYVIHTCCVTHVAERKSRQMVRRAVRSNPDAFVIVSGCGARNSPKEFQEIPGVDLVVANFRLDAVLENVKRTLRGEETDRLIVGEDDNGFLELPLFPLGKRTRATIKVQEGCSQFCSYCIVPYVRGRPRSRQKDDILAEANRLGELGYKEIVLTGTHLSFYGKDLEGDYDLVELLYDLERVPGIERIRLSSIEPTDVTDRLLNAMSKLERVCPHLHIPLQNGDDEVLAAMRRRYDTRQYADILARARRAIPDVAITTDVLVGFPGEKDENFANTMCFVEKMKFSRLHVFKYSRRVGTRAAEMKEQVPEQVKAERSERLRKLGDRLAREFHESYIGKTLKVLVERSVGKGKVKGYSGKYIPAECPGKIRELRGQVVPVVVEEANAGGVTGVLR